MPTVISCDQCQRQLRVPDEAVGKRVRCPSCKNVFLAGEPGWEVVDDAGAEPEEEDRPARESADDDRPRRRREPDDDDDDRPLEFNVVIKKDPDKELKGSYKARVVEAGLKLRKGKERPWLIPVGTPASVLGGNKLALGLDGRQVEVQIVRIRAYTKRLTRDVARFLQGKKKWLDPDGYTMEWYLFLPAVLPVAIPILTLGGALPAVIGFGFGGACLGIAQQENWPTALRLTLSLVLAVLAYVLIIVLFLALHVGQLPPALGGNAR